MRMVNSPFNFVKLSIRSKQAPLLAVVVVSVMATLLTIVVCINRPLFSANVAAAKSGKAKQSDGRAERVLAASYYNVKDGWRSTLMLSNQGPTAMPVQITLYNLSGERFNLPPVTFTANEVKTFNLREYTPSPGFEEGSLRVSYRGKSLELGGVAQITDGSRSLIFDEEMSSPKSFASSRLEGVWWLPRRDADMNVVLSNTTPQGVTATVGVQGAAPRQAALKDIFLGPHETRVLEIADLIGRETVNLSKSGGISIIHDGPYGGVLARGLISKPSIGYSNVIEFSDPSKSRTARLDGVGLRAGKIAGKRLIQGVVARNVGESRIKLDGRISFVNQNGSGEITLPKLWLRPGEIREVDVAEALKDSNMRQIQTSGLHFEHTGNPGEVVVSATSMSVDGTHVFRVPFRDASLSSSGGIYPWNLEGESSAVVYLQNVSDAPRDYTLQIIFDGGAYVLGVKNLAARQVAAYDIRELRDRQIPDAVGRTIPQDITSGKVHWSIRGAGDRSLIGRIEQVDSVKGLSMTSACGTCCPNSFANVFMIPAAVAGFPGNTTQFAVEELDMDCFGNPLPPFPVTNFGSWSSQNTSIATVNQSGLATAVGPGSTFINFSSTGEVWTNCCTECGNEEICCESEPVPATCEASCDVQAPDFTIAHDKTNTGIRPSGIIGGINGADPPIPVADTQATVTVSTNPPTSGQNVTLSVIDASSDGLAGGWHIGHTGVRPVGTLSSTSGTTDQNGVFTAVYTAPIFSGNRRFMATMNGVTKDVGIGVFIDGLQELPAGSGYDRVGQTATHPLNLWGTATAVANLPLIASDYKAMFPGSANLRFNDMSLPSGGKFEIAGDWGNGSHAEHRVGRNCDIGSSNVPANRWAALNQLFRNNNVVSINDETASANHWHVRF